MQAKLNDYARGFSSFTLDCIIVIWSHWSTAHAYLDKTRHAYLSPIKISASKTVFDHFNPKAGCLPEQIKRQIHDKRLRQNHRIHTLYILEHFFDTGSAAVWL